MGESSGRSRVALAMDIGPAWQAVVDGDYAPVLQALLDRDRGRPTGRGIVLTSAERRAIELAIAQVSRGAAPEGSY